MIRTGGWRLFHHADLHRAGLAAKQQRRLSAPRHVGWQSRPAGRGQIEIFQRIAGRMGLGDVERLEVVPLVFDLGPIGDRETEPAHDVFEFFDRLRDRMEMAEPQRRCPAG